jgi:hypothetical protein
MMKERPIIFSASMVRAILEGRKTQTRRPVKWPAWTNPSSHWPPLVKKLGLAFYEDGRMVKRFRCPYGQPGDRLWVRETWAHYQTVNHARLSGGRAISEVSDGRAGYRADGHESIGDFRRHVELMGGASLEAIEINGDCWRPSIHMPRWASRLTLEVSGVRVERVRDISDEDVMAEGVEPDRCTDHPRGVYYTAFAPRWDAIYGKKPGQDWASNPWVWVVEFRRVKA